MCSHATKVSAEHGTAGWWINIINKSTSIKRDRWITKQAASSSGNRHTQNSEWSGVRRVNSLKVFAQRLHAFSQGPPAGCTQTRTKPAKLGSPMTTYFVASF
ncbi:hypothetical protein BC938DRAFT_484307 [Jimgerdemannia flammicorona]|uniref:Uncharacterized protein n=1 Tax=Jimgerdemannia flammicorona TaxID=994334 RepID=A0A433QVG6_9FUNG|nr:hypothetical protein BC938DRAFT_484307 [Jimgerdemannia flammicorona]